MRLFAIADLHLPSTRQKDMACFGWDKHPSKVAQRWDETVLPEDCVIVAGDISWASKAADGMEDFRWIHERPGKKILLKGNHDYWWPDSASKLKKIWEPFPSIVGLVHNCAVQWGPFVVSGSRLWELFEAPWEKFKNAEGADNAKEASSMGGTADTDIIQSAEALALLKRRIQNEMKRLQASIDDAQNKLDADPQLIHVVATHFPPLYVDGVETPFSKLIESRKPKHCVYGHLHGPSIPSGFVGLRHGVNYHLASCDAVDFCPLLVETAPSALTNGP